MSSSEQPNWLTPDAGAPAPAVQQTSTTPMEVDAAAAAAGTGATAANTNAAADDAELPGIILTMRLANMGAAVTLMAFSVSGVMSS